MEKITPPPGAGNGDVRPKRTNPDPETREGSRGTASVPHEPSDSVAFLHALGRLAYRSAASLSVEKRGSLLKQSVRPWDGTTAATIYTGGTKDTRDGYGAAGTWQELGEVMRIYAQKVVPKKGDGLWMTPALTVNGRCRDQDIACVSQLSFDCDGAGDWDIFRRVLDGAGLAHILQRSSSHRAEHPKWHAHIPLSAPWSGTKKEWRRIYRHAVGWFSGASELRADVDASPPMYGFDAKTDRLGQPWFLPARRSETDAAPETIVVEGGALELDVLGTDGI
jgi:hypothetical protein